MTGNLYAMITTRNSRAYTNIALDTFFKSTRLKSNDEFVLIDNDNECDYQTLGIVINNREPKSFAKNCNDMIDRAAGRNCFLLSNDVAFTPRWNEPLTQYSNILSIPSCNQTHLYSVGNLNLQPSMSIGEYNNQYVELARATNLHKSQNRIGLYERLLMGFYVFMIPAGVYKKVGYFDETFGVGGGEDVDYRLRAIQQDVPVKYLSQSYLLHFAGKSTWDGPEQQQEVNERNKKYFSTFAVKWGEDLANLCLVGGNAITVIEKYQLHSLIQAQEFSKAIKVVLNTTNRTTHE
jgi:O-antigen biosynthesis protein